MTPFIVLYVRGGRLASVELTDRNLAELKRQFCLHLIQKDEDGGSEHYEVLGPWPKKKGQRP